MKKQTITTNIKPAADNITLLKKHFPNCFDRNGNFSLEGFKQVIEQNEISFSKQIEL